MVLDQGLWEIIVVRPQTMAANPMTPAEWARYICRGVAPASCDVVLHMDLNKCILAVDEVKGYGRVEVRYHPSLLNPKHAPSRKAATPSRARATTLHLLQYVGII